MSNYGSRLFFSFSILALVAVLPALGQNVSVIRANSFEIGGFAGASKGLDNYRAMGGGNVTYAVNKYLLPYGEFTYLPGIETSTVSEGHQLTYKRSYSDIHGGVHVRLPVFRESPIVPYGVFGLGVLRSGTITSSYTLNGQPITASYPGESHFAINGGGGLRFYLSQSFGLRTEAKIYRESSGLNAGSTFFKVELGFFFQVR